jgi:hypothetical protein
MRHATRRASWSGAAADSEQQWVLPVAKRGMIMKLSQLDMAWLVRSMCQGFCWLFR